MYKNENKMNETMMTQASAQQEVEEEMTEDMIPGGNEFKKNAQKLEDWKDNDGITS